MSITQQLQKLAAPQTDIFSQAKSKPSLLFNKKQAASLSREAFFQNGERNYVSELLNSNVVIYFPITMKMVVGNLSNLILFPILFQD